jgi:hypothetical protein
LRAEAEKREMNVDYVLEGLDTWRQRCDEAATRAQTELRWDWRQKVWKHVKKVGEALDEWELTDRPKMSDASV